MEACWSVIDLTIVQLTTNLKLMDKWWSNHRSKVLASNLSIANVDNFLNEWAEQHQTRKIQRQVTETNIDVNSVNENLKLKLIKLTKKRKLTCWVTRNKVILSWPAWVIARWFGAEWRKKRSEPSAVTLIRSVSTVKLKHLSITWDSAIFNSRLKAKWLNDWKIQIIVFKINLNRRAKM